MFNNISITYFKDQNPHEMWSGEKHDVSNFRVFGSYMYSNIPTNLYKKFDLKTRLEIFIRYPKGIKF